MDDSRHGLPSTASSSSSFSPSSPSSSSRGGSNSQRKDDAEDFVPAAQMAASFASAPECEPYILPLFPATEAASMGHNVTWLCKALGSRDMTLAWRLPNGLSGSGGGGGSIVGDGECLERACVSRGAALTVRFLHPGDAGR